MAAYRHYGGKPHWDDGLGPLPPWAPDARKPWKSGQPKGAFIWPRDKPMSHPPLRSWRRWKDMFLRKGPPIYIGDRTKFGPTKPTWSNWVNFPYDNLGYRDEHVFDVGGRDPRRAYDFKARRFTKRPLRMGVWSDVKWGADKHIPLYFRDGYGVENTRRNGRVMPFDNTEWGNDFRYRPQEFDRQDWLRPWPDSFWNYADQ